MKIFLLVNLRKTLGPFLRAWRLEILVTPQSTKKILFFLIRYQFIIRYMRTWLVLDVISSFPIDNIILLINGGGTSDFGLGLKSASRAFKFLRLAKLLSLLKLLRLSRIFRYVSRFEEVSNYY